MNYPGRRAAHTCLLHLFKSGAELWAHGQYHRREKSNDQQSQLRAIDSLSNLFEARPVGVSFPFNQEPGDLNELEARSFKLSVLFRGRITSSAEHCVDVLAWPGPRVRSELSILSSLNMMAEAAVDYGLCFHVDRVPSEITMFQLDLFSQHQPTSRTQ
jgi:hypothetical protein